jgi:MtfA peptidase
VSDDVMSNLIQAGPTAVRRLSDEQRARYEVHATRLVERVSWEGTRDVPVSEQMMYTVSAHAALLAAGFEPRTDPFRHVTSIIIHPRTIVSREVRPGPARGVVTDSPDHRAGQAGHGRGPILLDWRTVQHDAAHPERGINVVFHEFAHKLDDLDGVMDGIPPQPDRQSRAEWQQTFGTNFRRLKRRGSGGLVRAYGATSPAEYFAVTSELFFTRPTDLQQGVPRVYARLSAFYNQDPASSATHR